MEEMLLLMLPELLKGGIGAYQLLQSSKYAKTPRPEYEIPEAAKQALLSASSQATATELPGQSLAEEKLAANVAKGISAAKESTDSPANTLGMIADLVGQQQSATQSMAGSAAQQWASNQDVLRNQLAAMATEQSNKWQWDKAQPYLSAMGAAKSLQNAGLTNIVNTAEGMGNIALEDKYLKLLSGETPGGKKDIAKPSDLMTQLWLQNRAKKIGGMSGLGEYPDFSFPKKKYGFNSDFITGAF